MKTIRSRYRQQLIACCLSLFGGATQASAMEALPPVNPSIVPELREHTAHFKKKIYKIADNVYSAVGWNISNVVMIEGDRGVILVDVGLSPETSREIKAEFAKITGKPVVAIIYSHFHHDHIDGVKAFVTEEQVKSGQVDIYAHRTFSEHLWGESNRLGTILGVRAGYTFGMFLPAEDKEQMNAGIGPIARGGNPGSFIPPTRLIDNYLKTTIAGVELEIIFSPSEAPDELAVYLPQNRVLIDTEVLQGPTFPNVYSLRGTQFREPEPWIASIDRLRRLNADFLVPTHGQPVYGAAKVEEVLRMTRDGIQYVHDQTVRYMNKGLPPELLVQTVKLPPHLANYKPYLREYYGTVKQAVRQIYSGYLGWFEGDPVKLNPLPPQAKADKLIALMGGRERLLKEARKALSGGESQWAAELSSYLISADPQDSEARLIKATALRTLGYASMNINWRNWYLTSAMELEGKVDTRLAKQATANIFYPPDIIAAMPPEVSVKGWITRLKAEQTLDVQLTLGFEFTDLDQSFGLEIRNGVCQFHPQLPERPDLTLSLNKADYDRVLLGRTSYQELISSGAARLQGDVEQLNRFIDYFDDDNAPIALTTY
ncbi:MAG: MBL fold metallo-hydrolase [Pseudomonadales bacterium]|nr:MBL fold metallo-hydrolase [Pseudomonadales bacterium]